MLKKSTPYVLLVLCAFSCGQKEKFHLEIFLAEGQVLKQRSSSEKNITEERNGKQQTTRFIEISEYSLHCLKASDAFYEMALTYLRQQFQKVDGHGHASVSYDSANQEFQEAPAEALGNALLAGAHVEFRVNKKGRVLEVTNLPELKKNLLSKIKNAEIRNKFAPIFEKEFSNAVLSSALSQSFIQLPEEQLAQGDSWKILEKAEAPLVVESLHAYTLKQVEKNSLHLSIESSIASNPQLAVQSGAMQFFYDLSGKASGTATLERPGLILSRLETMQELGGYMLLKGPDFPADGIRLPMKIKTQLTIETLPFK